MEEKELRTALTHWLICNKDYQIFKKGERYWLELLSNVDCAVVATTLKVS